MPTNKWARKWKQIRSDKLLYLLLLPVIAWYLIFAYLPMGGLSLAFKSFRYDMGLWGSPWIGFEHFSKMFEDKDFWNALKNTLVFAAGKICILFPMPVLLAVLLNEMRANKTKKFFQTVFTFPHFITWVVLAGILINMFGSNGMVNASLSALGLQKISPLSDSSMFRPFIWLSALWKEIGWDSIIYLAAFAGIDPGLYEAASIDGANRFQKMIHISWPGIRGTVAIMFILAVGSLMTSGASFDQVFNLYSEPVYNVADTLDTFVYRSSFSIGTNFGYTTAVGFLKSVINVILITITNKIVTKTGESGLF
ncbi:ABC transporter permease [Anaeromassilibacillus sp. An200]|uniref:Sugar ABC transporter permease n=1 Tax=Candidatus Caccousia stercoris TaxID=2840723 RepID=A0A9D1FR33_9FIRM|nr:ABC transporter permease subunit [Anaeromassilibacillus sp. An200]OUP13716.1 protein lplB [Anaeromassilibacillus sp. An200]HIS78179.1 sugar ABC transporter permease [Candidatus Caccousia stercoris]